MWSFRDYLKAKCADPEFLEQYREHCCICPLTVTIISTIRERGLSIEEAAQGAGIELEHLKLLESAERCSFNDVQKLFRFLELPVFCECRKGRE